MTFIGGATPPTSGRTVLVYYVFDPHYVPEWGFDLAKYRDGKWYDALDGEELDYEPIFWAIVDVPLIDAKEYWA